MNHIRPVQLGDPHLQLLIRQVADWLKLLKKDRSAEPLFKTGINGDAMIGRFPKAGGITFMAPARARLGPWTTNSSEAARAFIEATCRDDAGETP